MLFTKGSNFERRSVDRPDSSDRCGSQLSSHLELFIQDKLLMLSPCYNIPTQNMPPLIIHCVFTLNMNCVSMHWNSNTKVHARTLIPTRNTSSLFSKYKHEMSLQLNMTGPDILLEMYFKYDYCCCSLNH